MSLLTEEEKKRILDIINEKLKFNKDGTIEDRPLFGTGKSDGEEVLYIPFSHYELTHILACMDYSERSVNESLQERLQSILDNWT